VRPGEQTHCLHYTYLPIIAQIHLPLNSVAVKVSKKKLTLKAVAVMIRSSVDERVDFCYAI